MDFLFIFSLIFDDFLMDLLKKLHGEISSFLTGMAFIHPFERRNDISSTQEKMVDLGMMSSFFRGCGNAPFILFFYICG